MELPSPRANPFILQPILSYSTFGVARQLPQNGQQARRTHLPFRPFSCKQMFHVKHFGIRRDAKPRANEAPSASKALRRASCARAKRSAEQGDWQNKAPDEAKHPKREGLPAERETERGQSVRSDRGRGGAGRPARAKRAATMPRSASTPAMRANLSVRRTRPPSVWADSGPTGDADPPEREVVKPADQPPGQAVGVCRSLRRPSQATASCANKCFT